MESRPTGSMRDHPHRGGSLMNEFVVGVDGSDESRMALRWAAAAAGAAGVPVRAVQSWIHSSAVVLPIPEPLAAEKMDDQIREAIDTLAAEVLGPSATVEADVRRDAPAAALLGAVTPDSVLVLGSRGLGGFKGLLLGSVSQECVEYASCPVVVVRTDRIVGDGDVILAGDDGSEGAQRALRWAQALAGATGASVRAVQARRAGGGSESEMEGDPRDVLVRAAEHFASALTVVGRRGAGGLRSMRLGSTANHLVRHSATNVAVVPSPDE